MNPCVCSYCVYYQYLTQPHTQMLLSDKSYCCCPTALHNMAVNPGVAARQVEEVIGLVHRVHKLGFLTPGPVPRPVLRLSRANHLTFLPQFTHLQSGDNTLVGEMALKINIYPVLNTRLPGSPAVWTQALLQVNRHLLLG